MEPMSRKLPEVTMSEFIQGYWRLKEWNMTPEQRLSFIKQHIELGVTTVDHADIYGNYECEQLFGEALKLDKSVRSQLQIVTKCDIKLATDKFPTRSINYYDTSAEHITNSVEQSLARLGIEQIDVLLLHRPDLLMVADEVAETFQRLKQAGKVAHFGVSNFLPSQFELLQSRVETSLVTNQVEINPLNLESLDNGCCDQMQRLSMRPMAWSCLAGGALFNECTEQAQRVRIELEKIKQEVNADSLEQVAFAWVRQLPCRPLPIIGSGQIERVASALKAVDVQLTREQWYRIWVASKGHGVA